MATTMTPDPNVVYVCDEGFSSPVGDCTRDVKLRGDDVRVVTYPMFFSPDGTADADRGSAVKSANARWDIEEEARKAAEADKRERQARANRVRLQAARVMVVTDDLVYEHDGYPATIAKGSTVHEDDPLVAAFPDSFKAA